MKTNNLLQRSLMALVALLGSMTASAQEAYVIKSTDNTTLTFYYDNLKATRTGTPYALNEGSNNPGWRTISSPVTTVEFDPSFANARPTSTCRWFDGMVELTSITGIEYLNTSEVTNMKYMFTNLFRLPILDLSGFNTAKVTDMQGMFFNCSGLKTIYVGPGWSTAGLQDPSTVSMFDECNNLEGGKGTAFSDNSEHKYADYAHIDGGEDNPGYFTDPTAVLAYVIKSTDNTKLTFYYDDLKSTRVGTPYELNGIGSYPAWYLDGSNTAITKVVFDDSFADARPRGASWWFSGMPNLTSIIDIDNLNTENMRVMSAMFEGCSNLTSLDVSGFNTAKVQVTSSMFADCSKLTSLDLRNFNTAMIEDMAYMFRGCTNLVTIYVSNGWSVTDETTSTKMFDGCTNLMGGKGTVYDANHVDATYAHIDGGPSNPGYLTQAPTLDVYAIYDKSSKTMTHYYDEKIEERRAALTTNEKIIEGQSYDSFYWGDEGENLDPVKVVFDASYARYDASWSNGQIDGYFKYFSSLEIIEGLEYLNMNGVTDLSYLFADCTALTTLDLTRLDTRNITNMEGMFSGCTNLKTIYVSEKWNTDKVTNSAKMFEDCNQLVGGQGTTFDAGHIDKEYARIDGGADSPGYFTGPVPYAVITSDFTLTFYNDGQKNARQGISYDLNEGEGAPDWAEVRHAVKSVVFDRSFKTARPTTTVLWFEGMSSLESVTNLQYLNTSEVTNMSWMFRGCSALENLDLSSFNTANVTDMHDMFENCICLKSLNVSSFNTAKVTDMGNMFSDCRSLTTLDLSNFDTRNVKTMSGMFYGCSGLTDLDLTNFTTATVEKMNLMFSGCNNLVTLDITSFDTRKVTDMAGMFRGCSELKTIYIGPKWNTEQVSSSENMFYNCTSIVGRQGTTYDANHIDAEYAHPDGGESNPGYMNATVFWYEFLVGGVLVNDWNEGNIEGDNIRGKVSFDPAKRELTLNNATIDCTNTNGIFMYNKYVFDDITIKLIGDNRLENVSAYFPIALQCNTTFTGDGKLTIDGEVVSIRMSAAKDLIIDGGCTIKGREIESSNDAAKLTVKGANTEVNLTKGISGFASITLEEGITYVKPEGGSYDTTNKYVVNSEGNQVTDGVIIKNAPYAVYDSSTQTLTFYHDGKRATHNGEKESVYYLNEGSSQPGWFSYRANITKVVFHESFDDARPTSTYYWFTGMSTLTSITNIEYLHTDKVTTMLSMFGGCQILPTIDVSHFNTSNVQSMASMFNNCRAITQLDLSNFNTGCVTDMSYMFNQCYNLASLNVKDFYTYNVRNMWAMFANCTSLTGLDLSSFRTNNLTTMQGMFSNCTSLTKLDLSNFNTTEVTNFQNTFSGCSNLVTIYAGDWSNAVLQHDSNMFTGCTNLKGGMGTTYDADHVDAAYARIDGGADNPGYFTEKPALIPGDANDDGVVSIADVTAVVGHILGQPVGYFNAYAADVNHSGSVTIADAKIIVEVLLGDIDLEVFMMETEALQNRMEACEDYYEKAKEYLESIDSGHAQTTLWQMASEIEAMMAEVQKQLENVSSEYEAEECLKNMHELQDQIEILNAAIYELQKDA